jgi:transcriptional regulator
MRPNELVPGTLELLILQTLARGREMYGFEIAAAISQASTDVFSVEEGSLYPALQRLLVKGWVTATWDTTEGNRRARYYRLTPSGRRHLQAEIAEFERVVGAIRRVIEAT